MGVGARLRWMEPCAWGEHDERFPGPTWGAACRPGTVLLNRQVGAWALAGTVAHEIRHLWQYREYSCTKIQRPALESDAEDYERRLVKALRRQKIWGS